MFTFFATTALVIFIIRLAKGGFSDTLARLATPLITLVMPVSQVIDLLLPIRR